MGSVSRPKRKADEPLECVADEPLEVVADEPLECVADEPLERLADEPLNANKAGRPGVHTGWYMLHPARPFRVHAQRQVFASHLSFLPFNTARDHGVHDERFQLYNVRRCSCSLPKVRLLLIRHETEASWWPTHKPLRQLDGSCMADRALPSAGGLRPNLAPHRVDRAFAVAAGREARNLRAL